MDNIPELDVPLVLGPNEASYYQFLVGVMRRVIEIGHININIKVFFLSSHLVITETGTFGGGATYLGLPEAQA